MTLDLLRQRRASEASSARPSWVPFALAALVWPAAIATFLVHLPGQPFPERVWGPWPIDGRWFPGAQMNSVVFHPPTGDGDYVVLRPGHRGGRVPAAATELRLERNVDDVFLEEARLDLTSEEAATMPDGGVRLSLQDFRFRPNDWYRLTAVRGELEVAPAALQVELWRSRNGAELLSEVVDLFRERYLGATRANDAPAAGADPREGVASKRGELRAGALGLGHAWLGSCAFLLVLGLGLVASTARRSARR